MICENKKNNKYCEGKITKKKAKIINKKTVCIKCFNKIKQEKKSKIDKLANQKRRVLREV